MPNDDGNQIDQDPPAAPVRVVQSSPHQHGEAGQARAEDEQPAEQAESGFLAECANISRVGAELIEKNTKPSMLRWTSGTAPRCMTGG
jgi:hypothetical protein